MRIVILDGYAANPGDLSWEKLQGIAECVIYDRTPNAELLLERARGAEGLLTNKTMIPREVIEALPELKYIGVMATGYNVVDIEAARERGIIVTNIPAYSTPSVGQMVFAHILNITQQVKHHADEVHTGRWTRSNDFCFRDTPMIELLGKKIGIVGLGQIGYNVARISLGFGMKVWAHTSKSRLQLPPEIKKIELNQLFHECDVITLHCPLNEETRHMVNAERLKMMKPHAILINTSRGGLIDEQALADALNNEQLYAAGLDVLSNEPPKADNPLLTARNCYITPHIAWATYESRNRLMQIIFDNVKACIDGHPIHVVS
jgi:glycerate dehydrogenase